ncbi:MAG: 1,4-alpha-glucan branching protein GlgB [Candidatus Omnitrophica bacterium]|nr:1,4-alpha-glucan branching protein GlgB [Candidatus Omnitrophota bacterium]MCM8810138.1 1,4-alpha-glucan branching protein GlgB [Candidatus Omnitrophota bacterium]MCM8819066.1 1,4-alpha-glucan branching protein GlgB [Candidatus Omnitrophota bacterium]
MDNLEEYYFKESFFGPVDLYLFNEGTHLEIYKKLGAHKRVINGKEGYNFAVWAPNAVEVRLVGDFNHWDGTKHKMKSLGNSGIWEIFIPGINELNCYKFEIHTKNNEIFLKSDPYGSFFELRPKNASITYDSKYVWETERIASPDIYKQPVAIYEMHLGSWKRNKNGSFLNYREIAEILIPYLKEIGFNWVEFLPISEHPLDSSWGYQTTGFFAPTSRYGTPDDFRFLIDCLHKNNIGVIIDWTPAHFPKDDFGLYYFDGTNLYEHCFPQKRDHPDWKTAIFNYGRYEVRNFLINSALNWIENFQIDGIRVDAVASMLYLDYSRKEGEWIPNIYGGKENIEAIEFLKKLNTTIYNKFPNCFTIAEESTAWPMVSKPVYCGGLGFGFKWNMGWMHDTLYYFSLDPIYRKYHHNCLTFSLLYAFSENFILPLSHDEVVYGKKSLLSKMPGDNWQKFANLRLLLTYMYCHPGKKLLFMGGEFGQINEWDYQKELDWYLLEREEHKKTKKFISDLNRLYKEEKAIHEIDFSPEGFEWIDFSDYEKSIISFLRRSIDKDNFIIAIFNFTPIPRFNYRIGVPLKSHYQEIFNSDSNYYGGSNIGNFGIVKVEDIPFHNRPFSISLNLPPLGAIILKPIYSKDSLSINSYI